MNNWTADKKRIILSGGGTLGSVTPLLALAEDLRGSYDFVWVGTAQGVEKEVVTSEGLSYRHIAYGKWRRYWSWRNLLNPFALLIGAIQSWFILKKIRPDLIISAGSFVSVPLALAGRLRGVPLLILQLDYQPGLANKIMAKLAARVAVTFAESATAFGSKAVWTGSPVRRRLLGKQLVVKTTRQAAAANGVKPLLLVLGGGTGAVFLNRLILDNLYNLTQICRVLHLTGRGKGSRVDGFADYEQREFLEQRRLLPLYRQAALIIARAGLGTMAELAYLAKAAVIIPIPDSHQEDNARSLARAGAAVVLQQEKISSPELFKIVKKLLADDNKRRQLGANLQQLFKADANEEVVKIIKEILNS